MRRGGLPLVSLWDAAGLPMNPKRGCKGVPLRVAFAGWLAIVSAARSWVILISDVFSKNTTTGIAQRPTCPPAVWINYEKSKTKAGAPGKVSYSCNPYLPFENPETGVPSNRCHPELPKSSVFCFGLLVTGVGWVRHPQFCFVTGKKGCATLRPLSTLTFQT
jgi:hypothetical protein